jgi:hypothetical protein
MRSLLPAELGVLESVLMLLALLGVEGLACWPPCWPLAPAAAAGVEASTCCALRLVEGSVLVRCLHVPKLQQQHGHAE